VDSTGLRVILLANEGSRGREQEFAITPGSPQVQRLLSITSVAEHMRVLASPDELLVWAAGRRAPPRGAAPRALSRLELVSPRRLPRRRWMVEADRRDLRAGADRRGACEQRRAR